MSFLGWIHTGLASVALIAGAFNLLFGGLRLRAPAPLLAAEATR